MVGHFLTSVQLGCYRNLWSCCFLLRNWKPVFHWFFSLPFCVTIAKFGRQMLPWLGIFWLIIVIYKRQNLFFSREAANANSKQSEYYRNKGSVPASRPCGISQCCEAFGWTVVFLGVVWGSVHDDHSNDNANMMTHVGRSVFSRTAQKTLRSLEQSGTQQKQVEAVMLENIPSSRKNTFKMAQITIQATNLFILVTKNRNIQLRFVFSLCDTSKDSKKSENENTIRGIYLLWRVRFCPLRLSWQTVHHQTFCAQPTKKRNRSQHSSAHAKITIQFSKSFDLLVFMCFNDCVCHIFLSL